MTKKFVFRSNKYNITHQDIQRGIEDRGYVDDNVITSNQTSPLDKWYKYGAQRDDVNIFPSSSTNNVSRIQIHDAVNRMYDYLLHSTYEVSAEYEPIYKVGLNFNKQKIYNFVEERLLLNPQEVLSFTKDPQQFLITLPGISIKNILIYQGGEDLSNTTMPVLKTNIGSMVGHHKDGTFEKGIQSPFTEHNVGGYKHRHQPIGTTVDRPERFKIQDDGTTITFTSPVSGASGPDYNQPYSRVSREGFTKSPINIRNIRITGSNMVGNFVKNYEIVSGLSRRNQNMALVDRPQNFDTSVIGTGFPDRRLLDGTYNKTVYVNKFAAPGELVYGTPGAGNATSVATMDPTAGEFSAYNTVNYRNFTFRKTLTSYLSTPSYFGGYKNGMYGISASFQKTHINDRLIPVTGTNTFRIREDNAYVSYQLPARDRGFSWINRACVSGSNPVGNNPGLFVNGVDNDIEFFTNSTLFDTLGGFSNLYDYTSYTPSGTYSAGPISGLPTYQIIYNIKNNKIWGKSTKRQISNHDNKLLNIQRTNNYFTDEIRVPGLKNEQPVEVRDSNIKDKYTNTKNVYELNGQDVEVLSYPFAQDYTSVVSNYYDDTSNTVKNFYKDNRNIFYSDKSKSLFSRMLEFSRYVKKSGINIKTIKEIRHEEKLYPRSQNVFRNFARARNSYSQKWSDTLDNRLTELTNSQGQVYAGFNKVNQDVTTTYNYSFWPLDADSSVPAGFSGVRDKSGELLQLDNTDFINSTYSYTSIQVPFGTYYGARFGRNWNTNRPANVVHSQAGKGPYPNSYDDFSSDIKLIGQDCSIIPEYRISPRLDELYAENYSFYDSRFNQLELTGTTIEDSSVAVSTSSAFLEQRATTDYIDLVPYFNKELDEYKLNSIKINVKAIKKLLPYEEFYPQIRMLNLAQQFSSSYSSVFSLTGSEATFRTALSPFYSPGIGFNSIKAGVGMPYNIAKSGSSTSYTDITRSVGVSSLYYQKLPWETILSPYKNLLSITNGEIYDIDPDMQINSTASIITNTTYNSVYDEKANNFYSEVINFFKGSPLSTIKSKPNAEWRFPDLTKKYSMDIVVNKQNAFYTYSSLENFGPKPYVFHAPPWSGVSLTYATSSAFNSDVSLPPNHATASGESYVRLIFDPSLMFVGTQDYAIQGKYTLADIIRHSTLEYSSSIVGGSEAVITAEDLVDVFSLSNDNSSWQPRLKWECPTADLNFYNLSASLTNSSGNDAGASASGSAIRGIWHQYAPVSNNNEGLFLSARYSTRDTSATGSLLDAVGFNPNERVKIGKIAPSKEISEALLLIPFYSDECGVEKYFDIDISMFEKAYANNTGIVGEIKSASRKYIFPPSIDFIRTRDLSSRALEKSEYENVKSPFLVFPLEFSSILSQQDLSDIWQGVMPTVSEVAEVESQDKEFFIGNYLKELNYKLPDNTRFKIFKVKKRASTNYQQVVDKSLGNEYIDLSYGYNWPYDYFSLVEMAEVKAELRYSYRLEEDAKRNSEESLNKKVVDETRVDRQ